MNKEKKTREKCKDCEHFKRIPMATNPDKFSRNCICDLSPEMLIDIYTRRPDWCMKGKLKPVLPNITDEKDPDFVVGIIEEDSHGEIESGS